MSDSFSPYAQVGGGAEPDRPPLNPPLMTIRVSVPGVWLQSCDIAVVGFRPFKRFQPVHIAVQLYASAVIWYIFSSRMRWL